jgi:hypothetical protein
MADDAATILAPPDPTWNPPPAAPPDAMVAAQNIAPVQQSVDVTTQPPSDQLQAIPPAGMTAMIPSETPPNHPDIERQYHEATWRRILDKVGTILGGDQTLHVTKDADGNIKMTHDPSTGGEKWGRIAAAALGGAAQGLANSQGPGGAARAAAAGTQYGLQLPKQMREEADAQATAEQKRMMDNANNALIHQRGYLTMLESQGKKLQLDSESAALMNAYRDEMANSPESKDFGVITGPQDLVDKTNQNQDFLNNHLNYRTKSALVPGKNGFELHAIATDPGDDAQPVGEGAVLHVIQTDPETGKPRLTSEPVSKGSRKMGALRVANSAVDVQFAGLMNNYNKAQIERDKADREKIPTTQEAAVIDKYRRLYPDDPAKAMDAAAKEIQAGKKELRSITNINNLPPPTPANLANWGALLADPRSGVTLAQVPPKQRDAVVDAMKTGGQRIAKPLTGDELKRSDLAYNALSNIERAQEILQKRPDMFGPAGWGKTQFQKFLKGGDPDAIAYKAAINLANLPAVGIHGVRGKWALDDLKELDSNLYLNPESMSNVLAEIHRSASEFAPMGGRVLDNPPTGAATNAPAKGAAIQAPAGASMEYKDKDGNVTGWAVNGKYVAR